MQMKWTLSLCSSIFKVVEGGSVELLDKGLAHRFFQELWDIRSRMTDRWTSDYVEIRDALGSGVKNV